MINETSFNDILHDKEFRQNSITVDNSKEMYFNNPVGTNSNHELIKIDKESYVNNDLDISDDTTDYYASSIELGKTAKKSLVHKIELTFLNKDDSKADALNENKGMLNKEDLEILDVESFKDEVNKIKDLQNENLPNNQINEDHEGTTLLIKSDSSNLDINKTIVESMEEKNTNLMITKSDADMNNLNTTTNIINKNSHDNLNADINSHLHTPETKVAIKTSEIMDDIQTNETNLYTHTSEVNHCANNLEKTIDEEKYTDLLKVINDDIDTLQTKAGEQILENNHEPMPTETNTTIKKNANKKVPEKSYDLELPETYHDEQSPDTINDKHTPETNDDKHTQETKDDKPTPETNDETETTELNDNVPTEINNGMPIQDTNHSTNNTALKLDFTSLNSELYIPNLKKAPDCGPPPVYDTPAILNTQFNFNLK